MLTGDYVALADGVFGRGTYGAITSFQRRIGEAPTGVLSEPQFTVLLDEASRVMDVTGILAVDDERTGISLLIPGKLLHRDGATERGTRWKSHDASAELETVRIPTSEVRYRDLYDRLSVEKASRQVTYRTLKPGFFVVSGINRGKRFYARFQRSAEATVGFSVAWEPRHDALFERMAIVMSNSLSIDMQQFAALTPPKQSDRPQIQEETPREPPDQTSSSGSGFFVTEKGHIATNAHVVEGCDDPDITGYGSAEVLRADEINDLAILHLQDDKPVTPVHFRRGSGRLGEDVVVLGYPLGALMGDALTVTGGNISSLSGVGGDSRYLQLTAPVQPGNSGGPLFDRHGAVLGVVSARLDDVKTLEVAGALPQNVNFAVRASLVVSLMEALGLEPDFVEAPVEEEQKTLADVAEAGRGSTIQVVCE